MINYSKLLQQSPTVYCSFTNSKGQQVLLCEHPTFGDEAEVIVVFPEHKAAFYSGFFDTVDMLADHKEYEPSIVDRALYIGDFEA